MIVILFAALFFGIAAQCQTLEEFRKKREAEMSAMKKGQHVFMQKMQEDFNAYVEKRDSEFAAFLAERWEQFQTMKGIPLPSPPKPDLTPEFKPEQHTGDIMKMPVISPEVTTTEKPGQDMRIPLIQKQDEKVFAEGKVRFEFFGCMVDIVFDSRMKASPPAAANPATISGFWTSMAQTNYAAMINSLLDYKNKLNLNDYGYYMMLRKLAGTLYPQSENGEHLMTWVMMTRSGYKIRIAYSGDRISLLIPAYSTLYAINYLDIDGLSYYMERDLGPSVFTYDKDYPDAYGIIDFAVKSPLNLPKNDFRREVGFSFNGKPYSFVFTVNRNLVDFYAEYPQTGLQARFDAAVSPETKESVLNALSPVVSRMSQPEAAGFLLGMSQLAFGYKTDQEQFGKEKYFFPEEVLFYPYSDCEDRAVWFSYLVQSLLGLEVVGIEYEGHVATAVKFNEEMAGDYVMHKGAKYVIADPTFQNAPVGMAMPLYRNSTGKVIEPGGSLLAGNLRKSIWDHAFEAGGQKGGNFNDIVFDQKGNACLTGYFTGEATFGVFDLKPGAERDTRNFFVACYNSRAEVVWAATAEGKGNAAGFSVTTTGAGDYIVAGSFTGALGFEGNTISLQCKEGMQDVFVAALSPDGHFKWAVKVGLDEYTGENNMAYLAKFTEKGISKGLSFFNENGQFFHYGLQSGPMNLIYLTGNLQNAAGVSPGSLAAPFADPGVFVLAESLKAENDKLVAESYERNIAGVFSVLNHMKYTSMRISGGEVQKALDVYNPVFRKNYPEIYGNIGKIDFMLNSDGIIRLETIDRSSVVFDNMKIRNGATLRIVAFENGDARLDVLSGISVGKMIIWYDLNFVNLFRKSGDLLFDYDSDHTRSLINLKEDILN